MEREDSLSSRKQSSGMWHRVYVVLTDVSEEHIASIFRVEGIIIRKSAGEETDRTVASRLMLENKLSYMSAWKKRGVGNKATWETSGEGQK
jgi:hypothetical protein